jgi:DNA-binding FadR family transcriptional regulator
MPAHLTSPGDLPVSRAAAGTRPAIADRRPGHFTADRAEEVIWGQAMVAQLACEQMTEPALDAVRDTIEQAGRLPSRPGWGQKAAVLAELYRLLADVAGIMAVAGESGREAEAIGELMCTVGPVANGMITSSRRRLLAHLSAGDADAAALEMETHLRSLHFLWRLAQQPAPAG